MSQATPVSIQFEGKELSFWTYGQLNQLSSKALKQRAMNVRDAVGESRLSRMPRDKENCIAWIIKAQILANSSNGGHALTLQEFGLPNDIIENTSAQGAALNNSINTTESQPITQSSEDYISQRAIYNAARIKNRTGSNIFAQQEL
eukprot:CAMPEP_0197287310 /NCGR_PEP_ID=MMETSP0890-20130614/3556_1 /TAXON_ID=44058 ORGANISM="Aureoumbra lagunensis, Strain CCMP1510" /NCGR_SAMPLE_ID=MMETSP0890 /ASSEMBLY_ACC=CAM_ASM_000533 /LENGTH=145 /DNA_ID=CAMNT_0042756819 /DNA_START=52 /DNA_END=489 /DNA_ORIENTATION=-